MSLPPIDPDKTVAGIALDPQTLERVIPESRRPDGTVRKQIKIRPGFTPQEDVRRFRGTKQTQQDANALPKGHIIGWAPPPTSQASGSKPMSKSAKKNAKRREKKEDKPVAENWEDDDDAPASQDSGAAPGQKKAPRSSEGSAHTPEKPNWAAAADADEASLTSKLEKLDVKQ
ncbi:hypothetical protein C8R47DRAFT_1095724 [Mycena vitilis]|nr:hypothetical protein C8R47DRAFT_1095724 [Mycena vitilis]